MVTISQRVTMPNEGQQPPTRQTTRRQKPSAARRVIQRGLVSQISTALFQPMTFYETLPPMRQTRQWLWVGFIILAMIGLSAVQQATTTTSPATNNDASAPIPDPFGELGGGGEIISPDGGFDFGQPPIDHNAPATGGDTPQTVNNWTTALVAASQLVLMWAVLSTMLIVVPMFKGKPPQFGENLQIAIYASLPLAVMATLQLIYIAAGGVMGKAGLSGLVDEIPAYATADPFVQSLILSATSQTTLFMLWSLMMVYFGGRALLGGNRLIIFLVIVAWVALLVIMPVVTGTIQAQSADVVTDMPPMDDGMNGEFGDMPQGEFFDFDTNEMPMRPENPDDLNGRNPISVDEMPIEPEMTAETEMPIEAEITPEATP
jgi:hypothetical protein